MADYQPLLERLRDAYNARDADAFAAVWNPDCEWHPFLTARVEGDPGYHGHNGIRAWFEDVDEMFSEIARRARSVPRDRRSTARPRADDCYRARQRRGGEQRGRLGRSSRAASGFQRGWAYTSHAEAERAARAAAS